jgi:xanthine dehydrogenase accessory factor
MSDVAAILTRAAAWRAEGRRVAIATVIQTWGSSPRPVGSKLIVDENANFLGSVSGGCVEGAVIEAALDVLESDRPTLLDFGVADEKAWTVGLSCGGKISILVESFVDAAEVEKALADLRAGREAAFATRLATGERNRLDQIGARDDLRQDSVEALRGAATEKSNRRVETQDGAFFIEFWRPPLRLVLIGAVHIAQALAPIAEACGYETIIIDPRSAFASPERFPGARLLAEWPDDALPEIGLGAGCALVALTHDPKIDDRALGLALRSEAFYIGALGSRKTADQRSERLRSQGFGADDLARIHGPVGLDIGAVSPAEIALSIMAEITRELRRRASPARKVA